MRDDDLPGAVGAHHGKRELLRQTGKEAAILFQEDIIFAATSAGFSRPRPTRPGTKTGPPRRWESMPSV